MEFDVVWVVWFAAAPSRCGCGECNTFASGGVAWEEGT